jgi:phenylacetate-CoA ligase
MVGNSKHSVPKSALTSILWPAVPNRNDALLLAVARQLDESQWWTPEALLFQQLRQIERVLGHALSTVPYYKQRLGFLAGRKAGTLTLEDFRKIPILRRSDIQEAGAALISTKIPSDHSPVFDIKTSGSTGRPIVTKGTAITGLMLRAANLRYHLWFKRDFSAKTAAIRLLKGKQLEAAKANRAVPWADGFPSGPMVMRHIATPVSEQFDWLLDQKPDYLLTFPSNLLALIRLSKERHMKLGTLREVITLGEAPDPALRDICKKEWGVPVVDAYSSQEFGMLAVQCPAAPHYHVQSENVLVEILDADDKPCAPGQTGRLVITALHNFATPLIRYEIGDLAIPGESCACGRGLPVITRILGRTRNMLTLPSGEQICPRFNFEDFLFESDSPIRQFQVIQKNLETLMVHVVAKRNLTSLEEESVRQTLRAGARHPFEVLVDYVKEIPRSASGKFEEFRSEVAV